MSRKYDDKAVIGRKKSIGGKKGKLNGQGVWDGIKKLVEDGVPCTKAASEMGVSVSSVYARARREGWKRPDKKKANSRPEVVPRDAGQDPAAALEVCQRAVTRALFKAGQGLMHADTDISKAMEPVDRALKLKRELAKESREQGNTTVVVETLVPEPQMLPEEE